MLLALVPSCARYAPLPPPVPQRKILEITLTTKAAVVPNAYYYIAMDTSGNPASDGPHTTLSGAEAGKNWTYYIRLFNSAFTERFITNFNDVDAVPTPFLQSTRYYAATVSGTSILVRLYLDKLIAADGVIWFNFITSADPLTGNNVNIQAIDYLTTPSFSINTATDVNISNNTFPAISGHDAAPGNEAADIIAWTVRIYKI